MNSDELGKYIAVKVASAISFAYLGFWVGTGIAISNWIWSIKL
jgi:hypothetical protein